MSTNGTKIATATVNGQIVDLYSLHTFSGSVRGTVELEARIEGLRIWHGSGGKRPNTASARSGKLSLGRLSPTSITRVNEVRDGQGLDPVSKIHWVSTR